jgi:hypothetical protein
MKIYWGIQVYFHSSLTLAISEGELVSYNRLRIGSGEDGNQLSVSLEGVEFLD